MMPGLKINFAKSEVILVNGDDRVLNILNFSIDRLLNILNNGLVCYRKLPLSI
jgi:hypothetical protein